MISGVETQLLYDGTNLVAEYNSTGTLLKRYVHSNGIDEPIVVYSDATITNKNWLYADHLSSIVALANTTGAATATYTYSAEGKQGGSTASRFGYTGQQNLSGLGVQYYKARMYSADLGRFIQTDPIGMADDMNLYAYVGNDSVNRRDPSGLAGVSFGSSGSVSGSSDYSSVSQSSDYWGQSFQVAGGKAEMNEGEAEDMLRNSSPGSRGGGASGGGTSGGGTSGGGTLSPSGSSSGRTTPMSTGTGSGQRGNNQSQNEMARSVANSVNLNKAERDVFHKNISKQGYNYIELEEIARGVKDGSIR